MSDNKKWTLDGDLRWVQEGCSDEHFYYYNDGYEICPECDLFLEPGGE